MTVDLTMCMTGNVRSYIRVTSVQQQSLFKIGLLHIYYIRLLQVVKLTNRSKLKQTQLLNHFLKCQCLKYLEVTVLSLNLKKKGLAVCSQCADYLHTNTMDVLLNKIYL